MSPACLRAQSRSSQSTESKCSSAWKNMAGDFRLMHSHLQSKQMRTTQMTGGRYIAETLQAYGVDHVFFMDAILRKALIEMEDLGIRRILTHSEKAAAYMAD